MGIDTDAFEFGDNVNLCFAPGKTPKYLFASFTGIEQGPAWPPDPYFDPNGVFKLTQTVPGTWAWVSGLFVVTYDTEVGASALGSVFGGAIPGFSGTDANACIWSFDNDIVENGDVVYFGGRGQIGWLEDGSSPSLANVAALLNIARSDDTKADFIPVDANHWMVKLCNVPESTNILIRHDFT